jgi:hypothetical protein
MTGGLHGNLADRPQRSTDCVALVVRTARPDDYGFSATTLPFFQNRWEYRASSPFCVHSFPRAVVRDRRRQRNFLASLVFYDEWSWAALGQFRR